MIRGGKGAHTRLKLHRFPLRAHGAETSASFRREVQLRGRAEEIVAKARTIVAVFRLAGHLRFRVEKRTRFDTKCLLQALTK